MSLFAWYKEASYALKLFFLVVVLPTLLSAVYFGLLASDIYISEARYAVRSNTESPVSGLLDGVASLGLSAPSSSTEDAMIVRDYILSRDMLGKLSEQLPLRDHYSASHVDWISRMKSDASFEEFLEYYQSRVEVVIDTTSNITTLSVKAFDPDMAKRIADMILNISEELVNDLSDRIVEDSLRFARDEVVNAEERVRKASVAMTGFRSSSGSIDPAQETTAVLGIVTGLESSLAAAKAELIQARGYIRSDSPQIKLLQNRVDALEKQVINERQRLASAEGSLADYTRLIDSYEPLALEQELAKQLYASTLTSLELAKAEAQRKAKYILTFVSANFPDEALEPERSKAIFITFLLLTIAFSIGGLVWAAIKDHMRI